MFFEENLIGEVVLFRKISSVTSYCSIVEVACAECKENNLQIINAAFHNVVPYNLSSACADGTSQHDLKALASIDCTHQVQETHPRCEGNIAVQNELPV
jgi:hypothetical protein